MWIWILSLGLAGTSAVFLMWPGIDLSTSGLFYSNGNFLFQKKGIGSVFTVYLHYGMRVIFVAYALIGFVYLASRRLGDKRAARSYVLVMMSVGIAAGLVTNFILKDHWGRARPVQVAQFGGTERFTPAWVFSDQCRTNCSFVGGDVSFAFCALAAALTVVRRRLFWISASTGLGIITSFGRIAAGAHFLSDCVIAGLSTSLIVVLLHRFIYVRYFP